jgi:hypothetical protein
MGASACSRRTQSPTDAGAHINEADRFSVDPTCKAFLRYAATAPLRKKEIAYIQ